MTTATPIPTATSAEELLKIGEKRGNGPLDREDPKIDEKTQLPRQEAAVAEAAFHLEKESFLDMITKTIVALHQWLAGPPASAHERVQHDIAEHANWARYGSMGGA